VCLPGLTAAAARCVNTQGDPANCGAVGTACAAGQACVAGRCTMPSACSSPQTLCMGTTCTTLSTDPTNCGRCGRVCGSGQVCLGGGCQDYSPAGSCNTCPCTACRGLNCCANPGGLPGVACVEGNCP
jgi:hypothetical protein